VEHQGMHTRYRLLETVRQYARDKRIESGEEDMLRERHLACFLRMGEEALLQLSGSEQAVWLNRLETEHDNLRAALAWCQEGEGHAETGLRLAGALWRF